MLRRYNKIDEPKNIEVADPLYEFVNDYINTNDENEKEKKLKMFYNEFLKDECSYKEFSKEIYSFIEKGYDIDKHINQLKMKINSKTKHRIFI